MISIMNKERVIRDYVSRVNNFKKEIHEILSVHEDSPSRVVLLDRTYDDLTNLSVKQDELLRQSLRCVESGLFRAAHVMAWAGFMDFIEEKISEDSLVKLKSVRPKWNTKSVEELRESTPEFQIIDVTKDLGLCVKSQVKALHGLLNKRNECAHPNGYFPNLNETLGFVSEIIQRIKQIQPKKV